MFEFVKLSDFAMSPSRDPGDAGFDFRSTEEVTIPPGKTVTVPTGIAVSFPPTYVMLLKTRSSMAVKGINVQGGVIDSTYRGEIKFILLNSTDIPYIIHKGDKVGQGVVLPIYTGRFDEADALPESKRGQNGFGSTGR